MLPTSPAGLVVRPATPADAPELAVVISEAFEQYRGRLVPESGALGETPDAIRAELQGRSEALLALHGSVVVGGVMIAAGGDDLHLGRLAVRPTARGQGVARHLVGSVEALAADRGLGGVQLGVRIALEGNRRFFAQLGYREVSRGTHPGFTHPTWINLRKPTPDTT